MKRKKWEDVRGVTFLKDPPSKAFTADSAVTLSDAGILDSFYFGNDSA